MRATMNYLACGVLVLMGLVMTYVNLQRPEIGLMHWVVVALMFVGAVYSWRRAEQVSE
jgi:hypothetical protein